MPELLRLRVYLDSNVLISASLKEGSGFLNLWRMRAVDPVVSYYAVIEVTRNFKSAGHRGRFERLLAQTQFVSDADVRLIPAEVGLAAKDQPILAAAIAASVDYLVTGDKNHFGHLYTSKISGVSIISPADFLALHYDRLAE